MGWYLIGYPSRIHTQTMSSYLLLRNNKESGPFTIEEIQAMPLKSYDLLWVVGKSAAWRYPGEIAELKSFAPPFLIKLANYNLKRAGFNKERSEYYRSGTNDPKKLNIC